MKGNIFHSNYNSNDKGYSKVLFL